MMRDGAQAGIGNPTAINVSPIVSSIKVELDKAGFRVKKRTKK